MDKLMNAEIYFGSLTTAAQELVKAEKSGGPIPAHLDFSVNEVCAACQQNILPPKKVMRCAACKAVIYCSKECATRSWHTPMVPGTPTHKQLCPDNKRHMERIQETQAIVKLFPWGRLEKDGSFSPDIAKGRFKVLGGSDYGYWSHRGGPVPHQDTSPLGSTVSPYAQAYGSLLKSFNHLDGKDLLKDRHLSDKEGWRLPPELIPYRNFDASSAAAKKKPVPVTEWDERISNWESWYRWRNLSKESPAALIMHSAMSVYWLLVHCLQVTSSKRGKEGKRVPLLIHFLGAEVELNYLPTFSELALLLPYHDIKLVIFGGGVTRLLSEASKTRSAVANQSPVFTYEAPKECGAGQISIHLYAGSSTWTTSGPNNALSSHGGKPDAMVACNAGLGSYREWIPVIQEVHRLGIPFATTEYAEQSAETQRGNMGLMLGGLHYAGKGKAQEYEIGLNPFQQPGQRGIPMYRLPNVVNGFTLVVWKGVGVAETEEVAEGVEKDMGKLELEDLD